MYPIRKLIRTCMKWTDPCRIRKRWRKYRKTSETGQKKDRKPVSAVTVISCRIWTRSRKGTACIGSPLLMNVTDVCR